MSVPWILTVNFCSSCPECADAAGFQAHSAEVARKAWQFCDSQAPNEAGDNRLKCGCYFGAARVTPELSADLEARFKLMKRAPKT